MLPPSDDVDFEVTSILNTLRRAAPPSDAPDAPAGSDLRSFSHSAYQFEQDLRDSLRRAASSAIGRADADTDSGSRPAYPYQLVPTPVDASPPPWAKKAFKIASLRPDGVPVSVYDGVTEYRIGATLMQRARPGHSGGLYVFRTLPECMAKAAKAFPRGT